MTNEELLAKIKAEIERRIIYAIGFRDNVEQEERASFFNGEAVALKHLLSFLSTLEEQTKEVHNPIFDECVANVDADTREEVRENIDSEQVLYDHFGQVKDFTLGMRIGKYFYELGCHRTAEKYDEIEYNRQRMNQDEELTIEQERYWEKNKLVVGEDIDWCEFCRIAFHFAKWGAEHAKVDVTDFCKPIDPGIAQCIADHSWEMLGEDEKPVPSDLQEYASRAGFDYVDNIVQEHPGHRFNDHDVEYAYRDGIIAGAKWQAEHLKKEEPPVSDDLEEAARKYQEGVPVDTTIHYCGAEEDVYFANRLVDAVIFGAKWQAEQLLKSSPLPEDTVLFNKGVEEGKRLAEMEQADLFTIVALDAAQRAKEQMMKDAVEGEITKDNRGNNVVRAGSFNKDFEYGDKVRVIVIPKTDKK